MLLKHAKSKKLDFEEEASSKGKSFLVDRIGLTINTKGEVLLVSSTLTVFRVESDEDNSDFSVDSLELSQKQREYATDYADYGDYGNSNEAKVSGGAVGAAKGGHENLPSTDVLMRRQNDEFTYLTGQQ